MDKKNKTRSVLSIAFLIIIVIVITVCVMLFIEKLNKEDNDNIVEKISKIMVLPDEEPIINTISDTPDIVISFIL